MTTGLVRFQEEAKHGAGLGLLRRWDYYDAEDKLIIKYWGGDAETYSGDAAQRILAWLRENSAFPAIAPEASS